MYVLYIYFSSLLFGEGIHGNVNEAESHRVEHYKTGATYENWTGGTSRLQVNAWSTVSEIPFDDRRPFWSRRRLLFRVYKKITQRVVRMIKESCSFSTIFFSLLRGKSLLESWGNTFLLTRLTATLMSRPAACYFHWTEEVI